MPVPEAAQLGEWTGSQRGIPMHVTLLCPFMAPGRLDGRVVARLRRLFAEGRPFRFTLGGVCAFPDGTTYLAPEPAEPFVELVEALVRSFPDHPPYGGAHATIVPHLTFDPDEAGDLGSKLPLECLADEVWLMEETPEDGWRRHTAFPLGRRRDRSLYSPR